MGDRRTFTNWPEVVQVLEKDLQLKKITLDQGACAAPSEETNMLVDFNEGSRNSGWSS